MSEKNEKIKTSIYLHPRTFKEIDEIYEEAGFKSKSELMEAAIQFYLGYLTSEDTSDYLPEVIDVSLKSIVGSLEDRTCNIMFKSVPIIEVIDKIIFIYFAF
jgi:metal-responsive CopG/Arc/MetJ family transcriptional regulator